MSLIYPNIVPENNLRLPDALTIEHGPAPLLARFVLEADKAARAVGIHLRVRNDFVTLAALNEEQVALGNWYPLVDTFDPRRTDISAENAFWLCGENDKGEVVCTNAARIYYWPDTNFGEQAVAMIYGRDEGQRCIIPDEAARSINGVVQSMGAMWIHPDYRGRGRLARWATRVLKAYGLSRWPLDWVISYIKAPYVDSGLGYIYGGAHFSRGIYYPERDYGELVLSYTSRDELYADLDAFLAQALSPAPETEPALAPLLAQEVMNTSPEGARQGSSRRS
jgi:GNAT superfamily N-acetyltransferase